MYPIPAASPHTDAEGLEGIPPVDTRYTKSNWCVFQAAIAILMVEATIHPPSPHQNTRDEKISQKAQCWMAASTASALLRERNFDALLDVMRMERIQDLRKIAVHDPVEGIDRKPYAVVGEAVLREVVRADLVGPVA